ncbi:protein PSK SIMULATOR 1-like [Carex rostrata]
MAPDSWLTKFRSAVSPRLAASLRSTLINPSHNSTTTRISILAFEVASVMSKLLHLWQSLTDSQLSRLRHDTISSEGIRKVVSDDDSFLLSLVCAELSDVLRLVSESISALSYKCTDPSLRQFKNCLIEFADTGIDRNRWLMSRKEMDSKAKKMDRLITATSSLHKEIDKLADAEHSLKKLLQCTSPGFQKGNLVRNGKISAVADLQQKIFWSKQEVKYLKQTSLWNYRYDAMVLLMARSAFMVMSRIKQIFGFGQDNPVPLYRSASLSAMVHPSLDAPSVESKPKFVSVSGPLFPNKIVKQCDFFESNKEALVPPPMTLGASALATHYANLIILIEKMTRTPRSLGTDTRDDMYAMLTASVRIKLRERLRGVQWDPESVSDASLATEWKCALHSIIGWLGPMAHATIRWQSERSFEQRRSSSGSKGNVLLIQTLHFANRDKVEAAIVELLVGINYVWRFEKEMEYRREMLLIQFESELCKKAEDIDVKHGDVENEKHEEDGFV